MTYLAQVAFVLMNILLESCGFHVPVCSMDSAAASTKRHRAPRFPQHEIRAALRRMFDGWHIEEHIPYLEGVLECDIFSAYSEKVSPGACTATSPPLPPCTAGREQRGQVEAALGLQVGAIHSKHCIGPFAAQGDGAEAHLDSARRLASVGSLPAATQLPGDVDLRFAASYTLLVRMQSCYPFLLWAQAAKILLLTQL